MTNIKASIIIPAAGLGSRMGYDKNKTMLNLHGKPILEHTINLFASLKETQQIILVCRTEEMAYMAKLLKNINKASCSQWQWDIIEGGAERYLSVQNGVKAVIDNVDVIAVHDAVRPFVKQTTILEAFKTAFLKNTALVGVFAKDTIKIVSPSGIVINTPNRATVFQAQTPQVFKRDIFISCNNSLTPNKHYTDDCSIVEAQGFDINIIQGNYDNIKITTPEDLIQAEVILANQ